MIKNLINPEEKNNIRGIRGKQNIKRIDVILVEFKIKNKKIVDIENKYIFAPIGFLKPKKSKNR